MELLKLKYFRALAREEHLSNTAEKLMISQPALSIAIKSMEDELGVKLFDRKGRGIALNDNGKAYLKYVQSALDSLDAGAAEMRRRKSEGYSTINLGIQSPYVWQDLTCEFVTIHPECYLSQRSIEDGSYLYQLIDGELDFYIGNIYDLPDPDSLTQLDHLVFAEGRMVVIAPENSPIAKRASVSLEELKDEVFISRPKGQVFQQFTDRMCRNAGFTPKISLTCDYTTREAMVAQNQGLSFSSTLASRWLNQKGVTAVPIEGDAAIRQQHLIWKKGREFSAGMQVFKDFIEQCSANFV